MDDDRLVMITSKIATEVGEIFIYDKTGKLLHTHVLPCEAYQPAIGTINRYELFYLLTTTNEWGILNIKDFTERRGKFEFLKPAPFRSRVHFFPESKIICIWEMGDFQEKSGRLTFMPYPSEVGAANYENWVVQVAEIWNHSIQPLNLRNRLVIYHGKVEDKIKWTVYDFEAKTITPYEVAKPENNNEYCLKHVAELRAGVFLLSIEAMNPDLRYMVYDDARKNEPLKPFKAKLDDKTFEIMSIGPWLYVFEFNVDANGTQLNAPLRVISKDSQEQVFQDEGFVGASVFYFLGTTNDQYILRLDATLHHPAKVRVETLRATSQKELYVFTLKQMSKGKMTVDMIQNVLDAFEEE
jgi:hypothetical protein